jgi:hypothetical protein
MYTAISCKELGIECNVVSDDWFEIEEIYQAACSVARSKVA